MKKILIFLLLIISLVMIPSCSFDKKGNIADYVGEYALDAATEKTYHIAWNNKTLLSEKNLFDYTFHIVINEDNTILFTDSNGNEIKGRIKCYEKYCKFISIPLSRSYKFYLRYDNSLYYSYESKHMSVEYDVTYRSIVLTKVS